MPLMITQHANLCRSLCKASCPLRANCISQFSVISKLVLDALRSCIQITEKVLNETGPKTECWGMSLVTVHWADVAPFTMALSSTAEPAHRQEKHLYAYLKVGQLVQKDVVRDSIKGLPKIQKDLKQHKGYSLSALSRNPEHLPVVNRNYFSLELVLLFLC